ncbi:DXO protein, partial [Amia calva]|nr:DXO protein [Amia calva]
MDQHRGQVPQHRLPDPKRSTEESQGHSKRWRPEIPAGARSCLPQRLSTRKHLYERDFPLYKQPLEVGHFSLDSCRRFFNDARKLRYYVEPERCPRFNLRDGYRDRYIQRDETIKERLDHMLQWILANRSKVQRAQGTPSPSCQLGVDFVTWRGHLTKVLTTPYENREGWLLAVTQLGGTLYISEVETEAARRERESRTERHAEMMYWGYKFEQYACADQPGGQPDPGGVVNTNEAFCTVVQTRLADHRLLFSGEVDCQDGSTLSSSAPGCYIELKTSAEICTPKQRSNFHRSLMKLGRKEMYLSLAFCFCVERYKLLKWWAQSFLPGVPRIVAGFRDSDGVVVAVETFHTSKISQLIKVSTTWPHRYCSGKNYLYYFCIYYLDVINCFMLLQYSLFQFCL